MDIGKNLKEIRLSLGKTQEEIATLGGFRQGIYANWENNRYAPGAESLVKLAECFGCSVDYLLGREREDGIIISNHNDYSEQEQQLIQHFRKLDARHQASILRLIHDLENDAT